MAACAKGTSTRSGGDVTGLEPAGHVFALQHRCGGSRGAAGGQDITITGLEELIEALSRSDGRAMETYVTRLMRHIEPPPLTWAEVFEVEYRMEKRER